MAEEKKAAGAGKDLSSKIASAYRNIPPDERQKTLRGSEDIQNPELDRAFEKMVETYRPKRGEKAVVPFPRSTSSPPEPDEESPEGEGFECTECGHMNPDANKFCGMCGAEQESAAEIPARQVGDEPSPLALSSDESKVRHHHHYYHHHHYRNNPYLLVAVAVLLGVVAWQEFRSYRQAASGQRVAPMVQTTGAAPQTPPPVEAKPAPTVQPPTAPPKPATKPIAASKPASREISPVLPTRTPASETAPIAPPESAFRKLMSSMFPSLVPPPTVVPQAPASSPAPTPSASATPKQ